MGNYFAIDIYWLGNVLHWQENPLDILNYFYQVFKMPNTHVLLLMLM